ncbi:MAG TPA: SRPBCC family protein [Candidatus Omnitrophota bacterium]|nr:SRPBCC family protein [Candidatus Omnitrophota bacterium]
MNSLKKSIFINASLDKVWGLLADVRRYPEWIDGVKETERMGEIVEGKGLCWRESCELGRQHIEAEHEMMVWEPMRHAVIQSKLPMNGVMKRTHDFQPVSDGVQVAIEVAWDLGIAGMILGEQKVRDILEQSFETTLANWKELAEKV